MDIRKREDLEKQGYLFWPKYNFTLGRPLEKGLIKTQRGPEEVLKILKRAKETNTELAIIGHLRGLDGCGSSLDLPEFQKTLTPIEAESLEDLPSTITVASEFRSKFKFEIANDENVIEYVAPDYGLPEDRPYKVVGEIALTPEGRTPEGQKDAPAFIFRNIFGLKGIRIICEKTSPMALAGGMEASNALSLGLIAAASVLSGADLSLADIFSLAVKLENDEFGGLTGGQGHLNYILGNSYKHIWLSGIKNKNGDFINPYAALSIPLLDQEQTSFVEKHFLLVQTGKEYEDGQAKTARASLLTNIMWTDLLRDGDEIGVTLHKEKITLAARYAKGLKESNIQEVIRATNRYVEIRNMLCLRWINLMLDAYQNKGTPEYAYKYAQKVLNPQNPDYKYYELIRKLYKKYGENLRRISLYTLGSMAGTIKMSKEKGFAMMPLGAGGPGSVLMAVSPSSDQSLKSFLESQEIYEMNEKKATSIIRSTGTLKGYLDFRVGKEKIAFEGFEKLGLKIPKLPN